MRQAQGSGKLPPRQGGVADVRICHQTERGDYGTVQASTSAKHHSIRCATREHKRLRRAECTVAGIRNDS